MLHVTIVLLAGAAASGQQGKVNWNQFRGPSGQGVAPADRIPVRFGPATNVLWKTAVPAGHSSPIIWDNHIFLTASDPAKWMGRGRRRPAVSHWGAPAPGAFFGARTAAGGPSVGLERRR
jgi:hypothetical protein